MSSTARCVVGRITKSNALIKASYRLSLAEQRLILACLAQIDSRGAVPPIITIYAQDYAQMFGLCPKSAYAQLRSVARGLYDRELYLHDSHRRRCPHIRWVQQVDYFDGQGRADLHFSPKIKVYLGSLSGDFTSYFIEHVAGLSSNYAIRLYEMLMQWVDIRGEIEVSLEVLRERLQLTDRYPAFDNFRRRVIEPALRDLNRQSNLAIHCVSVRRGRKVVGLRFQFRAKTR